MTDFEKTAKTALVRLPARGLYDRDTVYAILDEGFVCHLGFTDLEGFPFVIPSTYGREGDRLYVHGSAISRTLNRLSGGVPVCVTVTLVDGMVFARSPFHHSINYRSVMIFGKATEIDDPAEKMRALAVVTNHMLPGQWDETRETTEAEANASSVLSIPMTEVSAKVRADGPHDDARDYSLPIWAGVVPVRLSVGEPEPSTQSGEEVKSILPPSIEAFKKKHAPRDR